MCSVQESKEEDAQPPTYTNHATIRVHVSVLEETSEMALDGFGE